MNERIVFHVVLSRNTSVLEEHVISMGYKIFCTHTYEDNWDSRWRLSEI